jgi:hypothetical protein
MMVFAVQLRREYRLNYSHWKQISGGWIRGLAEKAQLFQEIMAEGATACGYSVVVGRCRRFSGCCRRWSVDDDSMMIEICRYVKISVDNLWLCADGVVRIFLV